MGASGIASSLILDTRNTVKSSINQWKIAYLASVLLTTKFYLLYFTNHALIDPSLGFNLNVPKVSALGHIISGFLVGFGTKLGNGCTTGHGICGLARFSLRSLVGVVTFMATGVFAGTMCSPTCPLAKFLRSDKESIQYALPNTTSILVGSAVTATFVAMTISILLLRNIQKFDEKEKSNGAKKIWPAIVSGSIFALGLAISGMAFSSKIYGFLDISGMVRGTYDPTLITVMGGGFIWSWLSYQFVPGWNVLRNPFTLPCPLSQMKGQGEFNVPSSNIIDKHLILGEAIFGLGWGIGGLCPGKVFYYSIINNTFFYIAEIVLKIS